MSRQAVLKENTKTMFFMFFCPYYFVRMSEILFLM